MTLPKVIPRKMKVLQLISSTGFYGAEAVVLGLTQQLKLVGSPATIGVFCNTKHSGSELAERAAALGLQVEWIECKGKADLRTVYRIREILRRREIDTIHSHGYKSHSYAWLAASRDSCRLIATCHGHYTRSSGGLTFNDFKLRAYRVLEHQILRQFDRVICVSDEMRSELQHAGIAADKLRVIPNGIDVDSFGSAVPAPDLAAIKSGRLAVGIAARLVERKGHRELLRAARDLTNQHPETVFFIVGDGPLRQGLELLACEYGLVNNVIFTGQRTDMPQVYAALDIVALPSQAEGVPMVVIEGMAAQKAVIASRVGGIPNMIVHSKTGLLVEPGDHISLRDGLARLLQDAPLRRSLGENAQRIVRQRYCRSTMAGNYITEYRKAADPSVVLATAVI